MRSQRFTFLCTADEREALQRLASLWRRSKSDTVRILIADALSRLFTDAEGADTAQRRDPGIHESFISCTRADRSQP